MDVKFDLMLWSRYRALFAIDKYKGLSMIGMECGEGWFSLIEATCILIEKASGELPERFKIEQGVVADGRLRFRRTHPDTVADSVIRLVEALSASFCEICGAPGTVVKIQKARCAKHRNQLFPYDGWQPEIREGYSQSLAQLIQALLGRFDANAEAAHSWLTTPSPALGGGVPLDRIHDSEGCKLVASLSLGA